MYWKYSITLNRSPIALRIRQKFLYKIDRIMNGLIPPNLCFITCTTLCSSLVLNEPGPLLVSFTSRATGHLHMLFLQLIKPPAPYPHFQPFNVFSSYSCKFRLCFPRKAFPYLLNPHSVFSVYHFLLLYSTPTVTVLHVDQVVV